MTRPRSARVAWPVAPEPTCLYEDEHWLQIEGNRGYDDYRYHRPGKLGEAEYVAAAEAFMAQVDRALATGAPLSSLESAARQLDVWREPTQIRHKLKVPEQVPPAADYARLAADFQPALGMDALDHVLGPWADELDRTDPVHRHAMKTSLALLAMGNADGLKQTPFETWCRRSPEPPIPVREHLRPLTELPMVTWRIDTLDGDRATLTALSAVSDRYTPDGPVQLVEPVALLRAAQAGDVLCARVLPTAAGWQAHLGFVWPGSPEPALVERWVTAELMLARLYERHIRTEVLLRRRGHLIARRVAAWAWVRRG